MNGGDTIKFITCRIARKSYKRQSNGRKTIRRSTRSIRGAIGRDNGRSCEAPDNDSHGRIDRPVMPGVWGKQKEKPMNERPIIFSGEMARAILDGRKTQTRRVVKPQPIMYRWEEAPNGEPWMPVGGVRQHRWTCPYGQPGDRLWVRESGWQPKEPSLRELRDGADTWPKWVYTADGISEGEKEQYKDWGWKPRPSIHMPRWASRITLEITNVRVERLQSITQSDIRQEGGTDHSQQAANLGTKDAEYLLDYNWFSNAWNKINGKTHPWSSNPFVWVIDFKVIKRPDNN